MQIHSFSQCGAYHLSRGQENQDQLYSWETAAEAALVLADGASGCRKSREGARLACEAAGQILAWEGADFFRSPPRRLAYLLTEQILYQIEQNKAPEEPLQDYGSTLALAFLEKATGHAVLVNLGDGGILRLGTEKTVSLLPPGAYGGRPCLTTTIGAARAVEVQETRIGLGEGILLCSDGFLRVLHRKNVSEAWRTRNWEQLDRALRRSTPADDCSYITLIRDRR